MSWPLRFPKERDQATVTDRVCYQTPKAEVLPSPVWFTYTSSLEANPVATVSDANSLKLSCRVNGSDVEVEIPDHEELTLLDVLRDHLGITSPKNGCAPQAQCGCCTILLDGKATLSCAIKPAKAVGKEITTLEGLDEEHRQQIADSFVRCGGVQCGFCIPGMAMRGVGLCDKNPNPTREEIINSLKPHLCRCTGYAQIVDSIAPKGSERLVIFYAPGKAGQEMAQLARKSWEGLNSVIILVQDDEAAALALLGIPQTRLATLLERAN